MTRVRCAGITSRNFSLFREVAGACQVDEEVRAFTGSRQTPTCSRNPHRPSALDPSTDPYTLQFQERTSPLDRGVIQAFRRRDQMLTETPGSSTLKRDRIRAITGAAIMLLGVGATLLGWAVSVGMMAANPAVARMGVPAPNGNLPLILIPVLIGWAVYLAGVRVAGKNWAGVATSVGMGIVVLLVGIAMYVMGFISDERDPVLYLFWGTWFIGLGSASIAVSAMARSVKGPD
jgi:hypothetical protein